ncbi:hypothetical protein BU23DRAFT_578950 [Bimuria novae-zelandiae CBS 107.79]|uniref:Integrase catalytic domain-containing protein n=1 Tax=Bimuria novae-zelandiae CBS 107.79 TaxID=1447943 RepID=A0A6A5VEU0_9PLEO|nr:hypothetical protein BU23DRAFT_578950 [Bimuria novae-zelandiae CBS 107.79]
MSCGHGQAEGPPDILTYNAGTNFISAEFRAKAKIIGVTCKQIAVKAINNTAGPNSLVLTLLIFSAYLRITIESPPSLLIVADALNTYNRPNTADMLALPLQSEVLVWREKDGRNGLYKIAAIDGHNVTVDMVNGPTTFRSTVIKLYYRLNYL